MRRQGELPWEGRPRSHGERGASVVPQPAEPQRPSLYTGRRRAPFPTDSNKSRAESAILLPSGATHSPSHDLAWAGLTVAGSWPSLALIDNWDRLPFAVVRGILLTMHSGQSNGECFMPAVGFCKLPGTCPTVGKVATPVIPSAHQGLCPALKRTALAQSLKPSPNAPTRNSGGTSAWWNSSANLRPIQNPRHQVIKPRLLNDVFFVHFLNGDFCVGG